MTNDKKDIFNRMFSCDECKFTTHRNSLLRIHKEGVHEGSAFQCEYCPSKFKFKANIWNHLQSIHNKTVIKCKECNFVGKSKRIVDKHTKMIHDKQFKCGTCDFSSGYLHMVQKHVRYKHLGIRTPGQIKVKKQACDKCPKVLQPAYLLRHQQSVHENIK